MDKKQDQPFTLTLVVIIYFVLGVSAIGAFIAGKQSDWLTMSLVVVSYGLLTNRLWGLVGLRVMVTLQALFLLAVMGIHLLPGRVPDSFGINGLEVMVPGWMFELLLIVFVGFQFFVAFSKKVSVHFYQRRNKVF